MVEDRRAHLTLLPPIELVEELGEAPDNLTTLDKHPEEDEDPVNPALARAVFAGLYLATVDGQLTVEDIAGAELRTEQFAFIRNEVVRTLAEIEGPSVELQVLPDITPED